MRKKILITAALPYANGCIHFGHLSGAYLPADCYARFQRLKKHSVLFISGSDEYGTAIVHSAELAKRSSKEQADKYHRKNEKLLQRMSISFDHYFRTTSKYHAPIVQSFFLNLMKNGYIEKKETMQLYSDVEQRFLADNYVIGVCPHCGFSEARGDSCPKCGGTYDVSELIGPKSKITGSFLSLQKTIHWFLKCDAFKDKLLSWLHDRDWRANIKHFAIPYVHKLQSRAITRDLTWGVPIPLPNTEGKVLYVWFDAPIGYISGTQEYFAFQGNPDGWKDFWLDPDTEYIQFMGKDNIIFHAIIFPSMIMGQDVQYKLVDRMIAYEFLNLEGKKFSKSSHWYVDLSEFLDRYSADVVRYVLLANLPESHDSEFSFKDFQTRVNKELVGKLGNFVYRTISFIYSRMGEKIPEKVSLGESDVQFLNEMQNLMKSIEMAYQSVQLRKVIQLIMEMAHLANEYFDRKKPWVLYQNSQDRESLMAVLQTCLQAIQWMAIACFPIMPNTASAMWMQIVLPSDILNLGWDEAQKVSLSFGKELPVPCRLFEKIEDEMIEEDILQLKKSL